MYWGAGILVGFLYVSESCHRYSNLGLVSWAGWEGYLQAYSSVAFISGQLWGEQNSVIEP
jgi:hypothetical protein